MALFDSVAAGYGRRTEYDEQVFERLAQALPLDASRTVLDIATGTGAGAVAAGLSPFAKRVYAFDQSANMLAAAARRPNIDYILHDLNLAPFAAPEVCDHVVIGRAIQHL